MVFGFDASLARHKDHMPNFLETLHRLGGSPMSLMYLDFVFEPIAKHVDKCWYCHHELGGWRAGVEVKIAAMAKFSTFL